MILINCVGSFFLLFYLGLRVSQARTKYRAKADKAGDEHSDQRYSYPKLYAEGFSQEAKEFNCHQRAHQQALETYTNFVVCSIIGGIRQPIMTALAGCLYIMARVKWARGYTTPGGDPMNRYKASGGWGMHVWTSLLATVACAMSTGLGIAGIV